jgi:hypothetical protein
MELLVPAREVAVLCRNCGKELTGNPEFCVNCGAKPMAGTDFCPGCGVPTTHLTEICPECGMQLNKAIKGKTWKTITAGILAIVAGVAGLTQWVTIVVLEILALGWLPMGGGLSGIVATTVVAVEIATGIVAIVGGVFALKKRRWRLTLAGSICMMFCFIFVPILLNVPLAIAAIVLVVLGKGEFE